jgi:hypothetical protein
MVKQAKRPRWKKILIVVTVTLVSVICVGLTLAAIYKKEIISLINDELKAVLHTEANIGDAHVTFLADFPNISVVLEDVTIGMDSVSGKEVLGARRIELNLRAFKLLLSRVEFRSINVEDADIFIFKTSTGYSNIDVFKSSKPQDTSVVWKRPALPFDKQQIVLKNVHFAFYDSLRQKFYDLTFRKVDNRLVNRDSLVDITMKGPVDFGKLEFNPAKGAALRNATAVLDINALLHRDSSLLEILPSRARAAGADVDVSGSIRFRGKKRMELHFSTDRIEYGKGLAVLPDSLAAKLSRLSVADPVKVHFKLVSLMIPDVKPAIDLDFQLTNNVVTGKYIELRKLSARGFVSNHVNDTLPFDNANTLIHISELEAELDGLPVRAEVKLFNPSDIRMELHSIHAFDLAQLNNQLDTTAMRFSGGQISSEFTYSGKLREYLDPNTTKYTGRLDGKMTIRDGKFRMISRRLDFSNLHASVRFNQDTVRIDGIGVRSGKNSVEITGMLVNYVPLFLKPQEKGLVKLNIRSPYVDIGTLVTSKKQRPSAKGRDEQKGEQKKKISDMLDVAFKSLRFDLRFNVDQFRNKKFEGSNLTGHVTMKGTSLVANNVKMKFARGELHVNATMKELQKTVNPVEVTATMKNVHFKELFLAFNNFGQKTITHENINGSVSMDARLKMSINDELNVILPTLNGDVNLTVHEGRLLNVEPLQKMGNFLFKKRDFDDVQFAQINCHFDVANRDLYIDKMKVESTVLTLYIEGKYSMDANTDLTIQVPLSNLKRRDKSYMPENVHDDGKIGPSVFLRAQTNTKGETILSYDPFNKRRKKRNKG